MLRKIRSLFFGFIIIHYRESSLFTKVKTPRNSRRQAIHRCLVFRIRISLEMYDADTIIIIVRPEA